VGIDRAARARTSTTIKLHNDLVDFGNFLQEIRNNVAGNVNNAVRIPERVTKLLAEKANFDLLGLSAAQIKEIMEDEYKYPNWDAEASNFAAVFNKIPLLRTVIINNIDQLVPTYNVDTLQYTAGSAQAGVESQLDDILQHYD